MSTCATCKHWRRPENRNDFHDAVSFAGDEWVDDVGNGMDGYQRGSVEDRKFGECLAIDLGTDLPEGPPPLAVTRDASDYQATLYTQAEFGCLMWEAP
jgi:hypothetical protein